MEVVDETAQTRGRSRIYPMEEWADWSDKHPTKSLKAKEGVDFGCTPVAFRSSLHNFASKNNLKAITRLVDGDSVEFRFVSRGDRE